MDRSRFTQMVKKLAREQGFDRTGIAPANPVLRGDYVRNWLAQGCAGEMQYLHNHLDKRLNPAKLLPGARSVIVTALNYHQPSPEPDEQNSIDASSARIARYAWGDDYHRVVKEKLHRVIDGLRKAIDTPFDAKSCVDTVPLLERELAQQAGVGWIGKNTLVIHQLLGSYFFLGAIVTTLDLAPDAPAVDHCGSCTRCIDACPTQALSPYQMDARRCISYLTIEHRCDIPAEFHEPMGNWLYGCDVCQEVCPHNSRAPVTTEPALQIQLPVSSLNVAEVIRWSEDDYRNVLNNSAIRRATLAMLKRNAKIVSQNLGYAL